MVIVVVSVLALLLSPAQPGPSLQVPEGKLASALSCPDRFSGAHEPLRDEHVGTIIRSS